MTSPPRPLWRRLLRGTFISLAVLAGLPIVAGLLFWLFAVLSPDEVRSPQAQALMDWQVDYREDGNGAAWLEGMLAPPGSDPLALGRERLTHRMAHFSRPHAERGAYVIPPMPDGALVIDATTLPARCRDQAGRCVDAWLAEEAKVRDAAARYALLRERLEVLLGMPRLQPPVFAEPDEPIASFSPLANALRLNLALATVDLAADPASAEAARTQWTKQVRFLRRVLAEPDASLIIKGLAASLLEEHWLLLTEWRARWPDPFPLSDDGTVDALSEAEMDLSGAIRSEIALLDKLLRNRAPSEFMGPFDRFVPTVLWAMTAPTFKQEATGNHIASTLHALTGTQALPLAQRAQALRERAAEAERYSDDNLLTNLAGRIVLSDSMLYSDYGQYQYAINDLAAALALVHLQQRLMTASPDADLAALVAADPAFAAIDASARPRWNANERTIEWMRLKVPTGEGASEAGKTMRVPVPAG
jgi:hypothetical protein